MMKPWEEFRVCPYCGEVYKYKELQRIYLSPCGETRCRDCGHILDIDMMEE